MADTSREAVEAWGVPAAQLVFYDFSVVVSDGFQIKRRDVPTWFVRADAYAALLAERDALKAEVEKLQDEWSVALLCVQKTAKDRDAALARAEAAEAEVARLREALRVIAYAPENDIGPNLAGCIALARSALGEPQP